MTDTEIIDLLFERSEQAIAELERNHGAVIRRLVFNILGNYQDTEECVSDIWLGVWNTIPPNIPMSLRAFVCRIARNLAINKYRAKTAAKRNSQYDLALDELAEYIPGYGSVEEEYAAGELARTIDCFLGTLSYEDRFVFMRRYWYTDSLTDIAQMSGMSYNLVSVRLHRIKNKLKKHLMKEGLLV